MARLIEQELTRQQIQLRLNCQLERLETGDQQVHTVHLADGSTYPTDLIIVGAGVRPRTELARKAGLDIGASGGVVTNPHGQTSDPNIYAVGDMAEYFHGSLGQATRVPLAGPANRAGRVAGAHAASSQGPAMSAVQGTAIVRVFGLAAGITGLSQRLCQRHGIAYRCATSRHRTTPATFPVPRT